MARRARNQSRMNSPIGRGAVESLEHRQLLAASIVGSATNYATIQAAVDAAGTGAVINVDAGPIPSW